MTPLRRHLLPLAGVLLLVALGVLAASRWLSRAWPVVPRTTALEWQLAGARADHALRLRMPDGTELATSVYLPAGAPRGLPTVLVRLPYGRLEYAEVGEALSLFLTRGYAVVVQDVRGKYDSTGRFLPWEHGGGDGRATLDWIVRQPWSNGRVGGWGCSALGELQYALGVTGHPAWRAMVPSGAGGALGFAPGRQEVVSYFEGGIFELAQGVGWLSRYGSGPRPIYLPAGGAPPDLRSFPLSTMATRAGYPAGALEWYLSRPFDDPAWRTLGFVGAEDRWQAPSLDINTWGDGTISATFELDRQARRLGPAAHTVLIAAGDHCLHDEIEAGQRWGDLVLGPRAVWPAGEVAERWMARALRDDAGAWPAQAPPYLLYVIGEDRWVGATRWPPEGARSLTWHLDAPDSAGASPASGRLAQRPGAAQRWSFRHDPLDPVPSQGGALCCSGNALDPGPRDQRPIESRADLLQFTGAPLTEPLRLMGAATVRLDVAFEGGDADWIVRLTDVAPDGRSVTIAESALRSSWRHRGLTPRPAASGERHEVVIPLRDIAWQVPAGHRVRLHVAGSSHPRLAINPGRADVPPHEVAEPRAVLQHVWFGEGTGTRVELPVVDGALPGDGRFETAWRGGATLGPQPR